MVDVEIISMLTPSVARVSNICAATPGLVFIPAPTTETRPMASSKLAPPASISTTILSTISMVRGELVARHGERDVGVTVGRHVLLDHVDVDVLVGERTEHLGRDAGAVGHAEDRDLRLRDVVGDARDDRRFHALLLVVHPGARLPREARTHVDGDAVVAGELDRAQREDAPAGGRHLEHLVVGQPVEPAGVGDDARVGGVDARRRRCRSRTRRPRARPPARPRWCRSRRGRAW